MRAVAALVLALALAAPAAAAERPTLADIEDEVVCPTCETTLDMSNAPVADRMRAFIRRRIEAGDSKAEIKDALVAEFGDRVLAAPPREGFDLVAWLLPLGGIAAGAVVLGALAWRWSRTRGEDEAAAAAPASSNGRAPLDPELERRLDEELARFEG